MSLNSKPHIRFSVKTTFQLFSTSRLTDLPNAKLSGGVAVRLSAGLERGGAVDDEHEKNPAPDASAVFQTLEGTTVLELFTIEQNP